MPSRNQGTSNRTSLESKPCIVKLNPPLFWTSNRTSLESKPRIEKYAGQYACTLLIAPVWNRNLSSNILLCEYLSLLIAPVWNRNLFLISNQIIYYIWLLIAPVWNRNVVSCKTRSIAVSLLIAPDWNRNYFNHQKDNCYVRKIFNRSYY